MVKRIGVMTSGGDCPGLNTAIRAVVKSAINNYGYEVIGFRDGYRGLVENRFIKLKLSDVSGILDKVGQYWVLSTGITRLPLPLTRMERKPCVI